jgi:hypothetical protein
VKHFPLAWSPSPGRVGLARARDALHRLVEELGFSGGERIPAWLAPGANVGRVSVRLSAGSAFAEPRNAAFLRALELEHPAPRLANFWPSRGPACDALTVAQTRDSRGRS